LVGWCTQLERLERDSVPLTVGESNDLAHRLARKLDDFSIETPVGRKPPAETLRVNTVAERLDRLE